MNYSDELLRQDPRYIDAIRIGARNGSAFEVPHVPQIFRLLIEAGAVIVGMAGVLGAILAVMK